MGLNVDAKQYPAFWRNLSILISRLMTQKATGQVSLRLHNGVIKGVQVDRVYLTPEELAQHPPV